METPYPAGKKFKLLNCLMAMQKGEKQQFLPPAYRGGSILAAILMKEKLVQALRNGYILAVDWHDIEEMLGEAPWRMHVIDVCINDNIFPPVPGDKYRLSELEIHDIFREEGPQWMAELHDQNAPIPLLSHIQVRYFSVAQPKSKGPWMRLPMMR